MAQPFPLLNLTTGINSMAAGATSGNSTPPATVSPSQGLHGVFRGSDYKMGGLNNTVPSPPVFIYAGRT